MQPGRIKLRHLLVGTALAVIGVAANADLPLTVEDLITDKGKTKLDLSLAYANSDSQGVSTGEPITVQTGPTSFITLPTVIGERLGNSDTVVGTIGLRYGLTALAEVYVRASWLHNRQRNSSVSGTTSSSESGFADAWAGVNYQFRKDDVGPALLGFAEVELAQKGRESTSHFKSALFGLTTYKAIDPVVLSLTGAYRFNRSRKDGTVDYEPGALLLLNPSLAFAVNDRVTLTGGLQWTSRQADRREEQAQGFRRTGTDLLLGVGYGFAKNNTVVATFKTNASGRNGADLRVNWLRTF